MERPDTDSLAERLGLAPIFRDLNLEDRTELARNAVWHEYAPGGIVFLEGDTAPGLFHLHAGWLKVVKLSSEGREQILEILGPGELFNYLGVFAGRPNPATAIALESAGVFLLRRHAVHQLLARDPQVAMHVIESMADRLIELTQMVADLSLHTVEARLSRLLLVRAKQDVVYRRRWTTQAEMAARLGTVPDVLSRVLRGMVEAGIIQVDRQEIRILDRERLAEKAMIET